MEFLSETEKVKELFEQIEPGDIIWAKRYNDDKQKEMIIEGHREGPFIVLKKESDKLVCILGTGVKPDENSLDFYFKIDNLKYNLIKETYFRLYMLSFIDKFSLIKVMGNLDDKDNCDLIKKLKALKKTYYTPDNKMVKLDFQIEPGDIISSHNKNFIIIDIIDNNLLCVPLNNNINFADEKELKLENFSYLEYFKTKIIDDVNSTKYLNSASEQCLLYILKSYREYIDNHKNKNKNNTQRGSIILKDYKYYYIYGEEGQEWLTFEINEKYYEKSDKIKLGRNIFYTNYNDMKINKKDNFINIYISTEAEKDEIKDKRKSYKEIKKREERYGSSEKQYFSIGDIIENIKYQDKSYIIIGVNRKTYECLSISKLKRAIYDPILIRKQDAKIAKNTNIKGIKWLEENNDFELHKINRNILDEILKYQEEFIKNIIINQSDFEQSIDYIKPGCIIKQNEFSDESFVIKRVIGNIVCCVSSLDLQNKNAEIHYFNENNIIIVTEKQKIK